MITNWLRAPRQLRLVFLAVMFLLTATLGWLGWRLLAQDRQLSEKRLADQRETAADLTVATLKTRISAVEQDLTEVLADPASAKELAPGRGAIFFQFEPGLVRAWPEGGLIYYPELPELPEVSADLFAAADELEFKKSDHAGAIALLRGLESSSDPMVRGAALARIAASYLQGGQLRESLKIYEQIARLEGVAVSGMPAALLARLGALTVYERQNDRRSLEAEADALNRDLNSARWPISSAVYDSMIGRVRTIRPQPDEGDRGAVAVAEGVYSLWEKWKRDSSSLAPGRSSVSTRLGPVLLVWRKSEKGVAGFAAGSGYVESEWLAELKPKLDERHAGTALTDTARNVVLGRAPGDGHPAAIRISGDLPWTVQAFNTGDGGDASGDSRALLLAGMAVLITLILTGAWFIGHAVARELAVARLQSDFVSAVSHEFRTPLTTLCQLSEMLRRGRVASEVDRLQYYELMDHESHRLRRLVESLLNFGRLESGQLQFRFEELDASALVRQSAEEFARERQAHGYRFEVETGAESLTIRADRETLQCVFWNLFENAVKYSPGCDTVWVDLARNNGSVEIAVRDRGTGIPRQEQRRVFEKFVRGAAARSSDVRGTGIGLAMARQIVRAHGGDITLDSEHGRGSTFRVVLPVVKVHAIGESR